MAIVNGQLKALLKEYYAVKGVQNLLDRSDPFLKVLKNRIPVEGESVPFAVSAGFSACTANWVDAKSMATSSGNVFKFKVDSGALHAPVVLTAKDMAAVKGDAGGFQKLPVYKFNAAIEGMRRALAAALYGRGYGEIGVYNETNTFADNGTATMTVPTDVLLKLPPNGKIVLKETVDATAIKAILKVTDIGTDNITVSVVKADSASYSTTAGTPVIICIYGAGDDEDSETTLTTGNAIFPVGLAGWVPAVDARDNSGTDWPAYVNTQFFGVNRKNYSQYLCGNFYKPKTSKETKQETIESAAMIARRKGLVDGVLVINDEDRLALTNELNGSGKAAYWTGTINADKRNMAFGLDELTAQFSSTSISKIIDSPYCPKGQFWLVDPEVIDLFEYSQTASYAIPDGIEENEPGKQMTTELDKALPLEGDSIVDGLNIDYLFDIGSSDSVDTYEGMGKIVDLHFFGNFAVINPSLVTTGFFAKDNSGSLDFSDIVAFYK